MSAAYGEGATSYAAAGGDEGLRRLVEGFYDEMDRLVEARTIRAMHPLDLSMARDKLRLFLCAWLGGPNHYRERFGPISIPSFHARFPIDAAERDAWLLCMQRTVDVQPWAPSFKDYFMRAIAVPAERVRLASREHHAR